MTCAELTAVGLPAAYVPLPHGNGEQRLNALPIVQRGGGLLVDDAELTAEWIKTSLLPVLTNIDQVAGMSEAAAAMGRKDADRWLAKAVIDIVAAERPTESPRRPAPAADRQPRAPRPPQRRPQWSSPAHRRRRGGTGQPVHPPRHQQQGAGRTQPPADDQRQARGQDAAARREPAGPAAGGQPPASEPSGPGPSPAGAVTAAAGTGSAMALVTPTEPVPLEELGRVHFVGIGGAGMSGIARIMLARGVRSPAATPPRRPRWPSWRRSAPGCASATRPASSATPTRWSCPVRSGRITRSLSRATAAACGWCTGPPRSPR